jgi:peptidoglycan/LPS O-acetylase OafA/YrhL
VRIANRSWRFIHWFGWLAFGASIAHAITTGTDARKGAGLVLVVVCAGVVLAAGLWRYFARPARAAGRTALSPLAVAPDAPLVRYVSPPPPRPGPPAQSQRAKRAPAQSPPAQSPPPARPGAGAFPRSPQPPSARRVRR